MHQIVDAPELAADPRFATLADRRTHRDELTPLLDAALGRDVTANWLTRMQGRLPAAPVYDMAQALDNPFVSAIGMIRTTPHPMREDFRTFANPIRLD